MRGQREIKAGFRCGCGYTTLNRTAFADHKKKEHGHGKKKSWKNKRRLPPRVRKRMNFEVRQVAKRMGVRVVYPKKRTVTYNAWKDSVGR